MLRTCLLAACVAALAACTAPADSEPAAPIATGYRVIDGHIRAPDGRTVILRGYNYANDHKFPQDSGTFFPDWETAEDFREMKRHGFNSVRLLLTWEAVEPERGKYDEAFLDRLEERVRWAEEAGQWVILDMHQDIYSREFGGDGAPKWAIDTNGLTFELQETWYLNYAAPAAQAAMDNFYGNKNELLDHFVEAWAHVVERLKDRPGVIGYDLLNEPYPGSLALNVDKADEEVLNPFYTKLLARLAAIDHEKLFFVEPSAVRTNVFAGAFPSKLERFPDAEGRLVFSPHLYDPLVTTTGKYDGDSSRLAGTVRKLAEEARRLGAALWVGEWSVWDGRVENDLVFLADQLNEMDGALAGWSYWNFSRTVQDLTSPVQSPHFLDELARPQPSAVAGVPTAFSCKPARCEFRYLESAAAQGKTEILIPKAWAASAAFTVAPQREASLTKGDGMAVLEVANAKGSEEVVVTVTR